MAKADYRTRVWSIPAWFNSGSYVTEVAPWNSVRRVLRFLNGKKTHNIDLVGDRICWTNCAAQEYYYLFHTEESATQYWNAKFGNCEKQELKLKLAKQRQAALDAENLSMLKRLEKNGVLTSKGQVRVPIGCKSDALRAKVAQFDSARSQ